MSGRLQVFLLPAGLLDKAGFVAALGASQLVHSTLDKAGFVVHPFGSLPGASNGWGLSHTWHWGRLKCLKNDWVYAIPS